MAGSLQKNLLVVYDSKKALEIARELSNMLSNVRRVKQKIELSIEKDSLEKLAAKLKCSLFLSIQTNKKNTNYISIGRLYDNEMIDYVRFKLVDFKSVGFFRKSPEKSCKYFVVMKGLSSRLSNLLLDMFSTKMTDICVEHVRYALVFCDGEAFSLHYTRIGESGVEDVGPCLEMVKTEEYFCDEDEFKRSLGVQHDKGQKNVEKSESAGKVGRIYIQKQNLREINVKKSKGYK